MRTLVRFRSRELVPPLGEVLAAHGLPEGDRLTPRLDDLIAGAFAEYEALADPRAVYEETMKNLEPRYGQWVIFKHCMPFDVTRAYDEATQYPDPRIWTAERDQAMWEALEG